VVRVRHLWTPGVVGGKRALRREHRTEVTEVTEGDFGGDGASGLWVDVMLLGGKHRFGESAAQRSRGDSPQPPSIIAPYSLPQNREL
jgi:hypothetical protein